MLIFNNCVAGYFVISSVFIMSWGLIYNILVYKGYWINKHLSLTQRPSEYMNKRGYYQCLNFSLQSSRIKLTKRNTKVDTKLLIRQMAGTAPIRRQFSNIVKLNKVTSIVCLFLLAIKFSDGVIFTSEINNGKKLRQREY